LRKQALHALPNLIALGAQSMHFRLQLIDHRTLLGKLRLKLRHIFLNRQAGKAFTLDKVDGAQNAVFEGREIVDGHGQDVCSVRGRHRGGLRLGLGFSLRLGFQLGYSNFFDFRLRLGDKLHQVFCKGAFYRSLAGETRNLRLRLL
jgi:hypothetical protein